VSLPDYQTLMRPLLELHADGAELDRPTIRALLVEQFRLTPEELVEVLPSGRQRKFDNRAAWATTYLVQAGLLERPRRGVSRITARGLEVLRQHPERIDISVLAQFDEFRRFRQRQPTTVGMGAALGSQGQPWPWRPPRRRLRPPTRKPERRWPRRCSRG
jgi:restriction system protein